MSLRNRRQLEEVQSKKRKKVTFNERPTTIELTLEKAKELEKPAGEAVAEQPPQLVHINIPLVDILQEVTKYAKYIKYIVANKRRLTEFETVALTEECSSRIQGKLPQKLKDPGSFTIHISIGKHDVGQSLCDLGASINLMPLSGVIEDVLVQVGSFIFPADFIILDYKPYQEVPFILGHPFLAMGRAIIDVCEGNMTMRVGDRVEVFNVYRALKLPAHYEELSMISVVESDATSYVQGLKKFEALDRPITLTLPRPSIEEATKLELKPLPAHLHYAYLGNSEILLVIISSGLTSTQEEKLLRVLREHKKVIGWTIADIKDISSSFCMHKIFLEDGHHPSVEQQRRLNPIMKEVVKKEVIKLLDAGIIFSISDSNWIVICLEDQEKTTFTCPYGIFTFKSMSFGLCNAPGTFQRCMMAIFTNMVERFVEVFMDDFSIFGFSYDDCLRNLSKAFEELKKKLVTAPIIVAPDWSLPFELMCDASNLTIGAVLGQRKDKVFHSIYYMSKTLDDAQLNYTTTEKELLAVEFDVEIRDRKGTENQVVDHLSRLENHDRVEEGGQIKEVFPDEKHFAITQDHPPWYADYVNYLDEPYLYKQCAYQLMRRCIPEKEVELVLYDSHASPYGGHHGGDRTAAKVLQSGLFLVDFIQGCPCIR
ncbi:uncharacterized protein LOC142168370 [Nicotiana tabacum]|uniref:Uncharacterized protein LOC142168370 n=1 Tax=Nicotiana tabacum TaxID=4097 RepID=A0AC58SJL1_TOBAC